MIRCIFWFLVHINNIISQCGEFNFRKEVCSTKLCRCSASDESFYFDLTNKLSKITLFISTEGKVTYNSIYGQKMDLSSYLFDACCFTRIITKIAVLNNIKKYLGYSIIRLRVHQLLFNDFEMNNTINLVSLNYENRIIRLLKETIGDIREVNFLFPNYVTIEENNIKTRNFILRKNPIRNLIEILLIYNDPLTKNATFGFLQLFVKEIIDYNPNKKLFTPRFLLNRMDSIPFCLKNVLSTDVYPFYLTSFDEVSYILSNLVQQQELERNSIFSVKESYYSLFNKKEKDLRLCEFNKMMSFISDYNLCPVVLNCNRGDYRELAEVVITFAKNTIIFKNYAFQQFFSKFQFIFSLLLIIFSINIILILTFILIFVEDERSY